MNPVNKTNEKIKGYKVTNPDMTCRGFQYELNKLYTHSGEVSMCNGGFHFCLKANHCFGYYSFDPNNRVFEIEATGTIEHGDDKSVASEIKLVRELVWAEVLTVVNTGVGNTGHSNTGDSNTGNSNTGDSNTGDSNTGNRNTGDSNTGDSNTGNSNTGDSNTGYSNTGNRNTGYSNTGDSNTGNRNTGNRNTGNRNTGNWNTGNSNTGYSNTGNRNTGAFCASEPPFFLFDKPCKMTHDEFTSSLAYRRLCDVITKMWVPSHSMSEAEKKANPSHETTGGYLRYIPYKEAFQAQWENWDEASRKAFTSLENFDADIFFSITGVNVDDNAA